MSTSTVSSPEIVSDRLPKSDFIILPLLSLFTIAFCLLACEALTRHFFTGRYEDSCQVDDDRIGFRNRPNCAAHLKTPEGPWTINAYNDCGYRSKESCGPKPRGTTRIALLGDSAAQGFYVPYDETFAVRMARGLTQSLGRPVEVQNLGRVAASPISVFHQIDEALALKPDLVMMVIDPYAIEHLDPRLMPDRYKPIPAFHGAEPEGAVPFAGSWLKRLENLAKASATATAAAHFLFQNSATYVRIYMHYGDHADYLRKPLSLAWQKRLESLETLVAEMAAKSNVQHVPFVLVEVPGYAQAGLIKMRTLPTGVDPFLLPNSLQQFASTHGIQFIDTLEGFEGDPEPSHAFYVVDTHLNADGQKIVSGVLIKDLMKEQRSALLGLHESQIQTASGQ